MRNGSRACYASGMPLNYAVFRCTLPLRARCASSPQTGSYQQTGIPLDAAWLARQFAKYLMMNCRAPSGYALSLTVTCRRTLCSVEYAWTWIKLSEYYRDIHSFIHNVHRNSPQLTRCTAYMHDSSHGQSSSEASEMNCKNTIMNIECKQKFNNYI